MEGIDDTDERARAAGEETPLLADNGSDASNKPPAGSEAAFPSRNIVAVSLIIGTVVLVEVGSILQAVPLYQILENIICRQMAGERDNNQSDCAGNTDVQAELAYLRGWQMTLDLLPGLITAVPYGFVMDRYGRKVTLIACVLGILLTELFYLLVCWRSDVFPVRLTWASSMFTLIGGGPVILNSIVYAMLSDVSPEAYRSSVFFYFGAAMLAGELVFSSVAAALMQHVNVWAPIYLSLVLFVPVLPMCLTLPETLPLANQNIVPENNNNHRSSPSPPDVAETENGTPSPHPRRTARAALSKALDSVAASTAFLFNRADTHVVLLLATFLTTTLGRHAMDILLQFARSRYDWTWAQTGYLVSLKSFVIMLLLLVLLPSASYALTRWPMVGGVLTPLQRDLWLARASCAILIAGSLVIGLSPNAATMVVGLVVYCLGNGYSLVLRSLLATLVDPAHRGTLFNAAGILETIGGVIAGPLLAASFRTGLRLDGLWTGLPFFVAAALFSTALFALATARLPGA